MTNALQAAHDYVARNWNPLPLPFKSKKPQGSSWQKRIIREPDIAKYFNGKEQNVGVVLGPSSNGLTDVDLDCDEAIALASHVLPKTNAIFGRASAPASHWLYYSNLASTSEDDKSGDDKATIPFKDPTRPADQAMLLELRVGGEKGAQTVFPGSVHESDEEIRWDENGDPAHDVNGDLLKRARLLASICLLTRYWPGDGARHDAALSLGGFLARAGLPTPQIKYLVEAIARAAGDPEHQDRRATAEDAAQQFHAGKPARGFPLLAKTFGKEIAKQVAEWLEYRSSTSDDGTSSAGSESDIERLNKLHAVLPIGGKTRVVTFGILPEFPGRETIVMTQSIGDFTTLQNKYRHTYQDEKGELKSKPMGAYWIGSPERRQYDGGMVFMPQEDGDVANKLNLWRGFGVKPVKPDGKRGADGAARFIYFMRDVICSGNQRDFEYLIRREAFILQERTRSEVALGLQTKEEGCGKGFYERTMARLYGNHAMQLGNADHITGKFNPHLEVLLRVVADEALFVGDPRHRNALFGLITEPTLTIEPKGCGVYTANSYLNVSILSNSDHFIPVSNTARRFFVPTVSAARRGDHAYFASLQKELDNGGCEALLYHLLHEVDLTGFNVRAVPQTEALRLQRDQSLPALEAWWCELLEIGTLRGSDPANPNRAVSNAYGRIVEVDTVAYGQAKSKQPRIFNQPGIFDQARQIEPRLRNYTNDRTLGLHLTKMGCNNTKKVMRRQGWEFPPLTECRAAWEMLYPEWKWRNPDLTEWQPEGDDFEDFADLQHLDAADVLDLLNKKKMREE
jgi:hypothetical protein